MKSSNPVRKPKQHEQEDRMREQGYLSVAETARIAGVNRQTVNFWIQKGAIQITRVGPRRLYVLKSSLVTYLGPEGAKVLLAEGTA